jgi:glucokinase
MIAFDSPRLIADIGGLYARFVIETSYGEFAQQRSLRCADFPSFEAAMAAYLGSLKSGPVLHAAVAIANPVDGDQVRMTNYHWQFSIEETRVNLGLETLVVVNDLSLTTTNQQFYLCSISLRADRFSRSFCCSLHSESPDASANLKGFDSSLRIFSQNP